jgi:dipeptidyl aminopeptidase/acylaminoacyl peptidase
MKKIALDDFAKYSYLSNPTFSPNGKNFAFVESEADLTKNSYRHYIYILKGKKPVRLTSAGKESSFVFLDDDTVLFPSDRDEETKTGTKLYSLSLLGGEATLTYSLPIGISKIIPLHNGDFLLLGEYNPAYPEAHKGSKGYLKKKQTEEDKNKDYEVIDKYPWWVNGGSFLHDVTTAIYYLNHKNKKLELLSSPKVDVTDIFVSKNEEYIYYLGNDMQKFVDYDKACLYSLDLKKKKNSLAVPFSTLRIMTLAYTDTKIYLLGQKGEYGENTNPDFYVLDPKTNEVKLEKKYGEALGSSVGSDVRLGGGRYIKGEGSNIYFISTIFDSAYLYKYHDGEITKLTSKEGSVDSFDVYEEKIILIGLFDVRPLELYDDKLNRLTHFNDKNIRGRYVAVPEEFDYQGKKDILHGFILKPEGYDSKKKYPTILDIHGGPKTVYGPVFYHEMQYWASLGYIVIFTNPTGSDGRGNVFMDIRDKYGTIDYDDLMLFVDEAIKRYPSIDKDNLFETGGSYGGFMTNWIIGHTQRFKAVASQRSISNWTSFAGISDIGPIFGKDQNGGDVYGDFNKVWWHSPLKYADKVTTPTLFIHSAEDYRCPVNQGLEMLNVLLEHGVDTKMVYFRGENHELSRSGKPLHRIRRLKEITEWFSSHQGK